MDAHSSGEVTIVAQYLDFFQTVRLFVSKPVEGFAWTAPPGNNDIDRIVFQQFQRAVIVVREDVLQDAVAECDVELQATGVDADLDLRGGRLGVGVQFDRNEPDHHQEQGDQVNRERAGEALVEQAGDVVPVFEKKKSTRPSLS